MSLPQSIELRLKAMPDGTLELSVDPALLRDGYDLVWQYCEALTMCWVNVDLDCLDTFLLSAAALRRIGDKYRCLAYINNGVAYFSKTLTISEKTMDLFKAKKQSSSSGNKSEKKHKKKEESSFYEKWQKHEEEQKRWKEEQRYKSSNSEDHNKTYEEQQKRWQEEEERQRQKWREEEERQRRKWREEQKRWEESNRSHNTSDEYDFFKNCNDWDSITARYRRLMQAYHPDHVGGDIETAKVLNQQYEALRQRYGK